MLPLLTASALRRAEPTRLPWGFHPFACSSQMRHCCGLSRAVLWRVDAWAVRAAGQRKEVTVSGVSILLFWYRNDIYAIESR